MAYISGIEWTESTWNPVTGCTKISDGCLHCYAERMALRLRGTGSPKYRNGFRLTLHPDMLEVPLSWQKPQMVFVCSMSDLFHEKVPDEFILRVFETMRSASRHTFQVLTKRAARLAALENLIDWPQNVWAGVTVESPGYIERIDYLKRTGASVKFVSFEPLLAPIENWESEGIDWVIAGGESGPGARAMRPEWVQSIRDKCVEEGIAFFFKQWGGFPKKKAGRILDARTWDEFPEAARLRVAGKSLF